MMSRTRRCSPRSAIPNRDERVRVRRPISRRRGFGNRDVSRSVRRTLMPMSGRG